MFAMARNTNSFSAIKSALVGMQTLNTVLDCFELYQKLKTRFREGGFNMMKWASNSTESNELIKKEETTLLSGKPAVEPTKSVETENID